MAIGAVGSLLAFLGATIQFHLDKSGEILVNPGFEQPLGSEWTCRGCTGRLVNDAQSGNSSFLATHRYQSKHGPYQTFSNAAASAASAGRTYRFSGYVKVLPSIPNQVPQSVNTILRYTLPDGSEERVIISTHHNVTPADGWVKMDAKFYIYDINQTEVALAIIDPDPGVEFLVDSLSIVDVGDAAPEPEGEILRNPGFENPIGGSGWYCNNGCEQTLVNDSHTGNQAYKAFNRTKSGQGLNQRFYPSFKVFSNRTYRFSGYVKVLPSIPDQRSQFLHAQMLYQLSDYTWISKYIAHAHGIKPEDGWIKLEAAFYTLDMNQRGTYFAIRDPDAGVEFLVDSLSIVEIGEVFPDPADQVLINGGFENPIGGSGWFCYNQCGEILTDDSHSGNHAYKTFNRTKSFHGPIQSISLGSRISATSRCQFSGYVKILQSSIFHAPQTVRAAMGYPQPDNSVTWEGIAYARSVTPEDGWVLLNAEFHIPETEATKILFSIDGPDAGIDFLVDTLSITIIS